MKIVAGLGNPGARYDDTRHNVGWWALDRIAHDWGFGPFQQDGQALAAAGRVGRQDVLLVKPAAFMNRSGPVLAALALGLAFEPSQDLLVIVDDVALDVGRMRLRARGSSGGHNGLASVGQAFGTDAFSRLRIGVGAPPEGSSRVDWVLSPMSPEDEDAVLALLPALAGGVEVWMEEGPEAAMRRINR